MANSRNKPMAMVITLYILLIFLIFSGIKIVKADDLEIIITSRHKHATYTYIDGEHIFNEDNLGIGYVHDSGLTGGVFRNSYDVTSVYAGYYAETSGCCLNVGIIGGLATGYEILTDQAVTPMVMPYMLLGPDAFKLKIGVLPDALTFILRVQI